MAVKFHWTLMKQDGKACIGLVLLRYGGETTSLAKSNEPSDSTKGEFLD